MRYNPDHYTGFQMDTKQRRHYVFNFITTSANTINASAGIIYLFYDGFTENPVINLFIP